MVIAAQTPQVTAHRRGQALLLALGGLGQGRVRRRERGLNGRTPNEQLLVGALINYERGICSQGEFDRAQTTRERVRTGSAAIQELQAFIDFGERIEPVPPVVATAITDARGRIEDIRRRMSGN